MLYLISFILGTILASTAMCFFDRRTEPFSFVTGFSHCDHCHNQLHWRQLIPVISYLCYRGKCPHCHSSIDRLYPSIEFFIGCLCSLFLPIILESSPLFMPVFIILLIIMISDFMSYYVSDRLQILLIIAISIHIYSHVTVYHFISSFILFIIFLALSIFIKDSIGGADIKFVLIAGGYISLELLPYYLFLSSVFGIILALLTKKRTIPFLPCLIISMLILLFY